ncbi:3'-5' exonuclease [Sphingomonas faeni]|uniref:3'-5' exonuclease n=1 Tax=Sphingomonas faeni TaxID=185950 RepID=UPI0033641D8B
MAPLPWDVTSGPEPAVSGFGMLVFMDFEASSLAKRGFPIEVAWVFEDGRSESYLIRPAPGWCDWDVAAERIHGIPRFTLERDGTAHDVVANRLVEALEGHDLLASAPSWDGKWLSALLRAAGLPRHLLRLRNTKAARREAVRDLLTGAVPPDDLDAEIEDVILQAGVPDRLGVPAHRALPDAEEERHRWVAVRDEASRRRAAIV